MLGEEISTEGPTHIYCRVLLNPHAPHGKGKPEVTYKLNTRIKEFKIYL